MGKKKRIRQQNKRHRAYRIRVRVTERVYAPMVLTCRYVGAKPYLMLRPEAA